MLPKDMTRSLLIGGLYAVTVFAADFDGAGKNPSPVVQDVKGVAAVAEAPPAVETGPVGLPSLSDLPGLGWLGPRPSFGRGGNRNPQQVNNRRVWQPSAGQPFQIILSSSVVLQDVKSQSRHPLPGLTPQAAQKLFQLVPEKVDIFDIDLWDNSAETLEKLHASGKKVICYFSAGTSEDWRVDFKNIRPQDMGASLPLWKGERWLDIRQRSVWNIMRKRIELASRRGCDAIDPDNIDVYDNEKGGGFPRPLTKRDSITYVRKLAREARRYGMAIGLKNSGDILKSVQDHIQFAVNEECAELEECDIYKDFLYPKDRNKIPKPVFHIEYVSKMTKPAEMAANTTAPTEIAAAPKDTTIPAPNNITTGAPLHVRDTTHASKTTFKSPNGRDNALPHPYEIYNKLWPNASAPLIRRNLCLGTPPTGVGSRLSTVIKEMNLGGWVMYCDGGTADTRTLLPNGQTPKKGSSESGGRTDTKGRYRLHNPTISLEDPESGDESLTSAEGGDAFDSGEDLAQEGMAGMGRDDADLFATVLSNRDMNVEDDDVWDSDVGPILEEDLEPDPEKKSKGAGKDRRGPDGYAESRDSGRKRRAVIYVS